MRRRAAAAPFQRIDDRSVTRWLRRSLRERFAHSIALPSYQQDIVHDLKRHAEIAPILREARDDILGSLGEARADV